MAVGAAAPVNGRYVMRQKLFNFAAAQLARAFFETGDFAKVAEVAVRPEADRGRDDAV